MLASTIAKCVSILAPKTELPADWDAHLPHSADISLDTGRRLIVAACHPNYLFSLVSGHQISSVLINPSDKESEIHEKVRSLGSQISRANNSAVPLDPHPNGSTTHTDSSNDRSLRDPNGPPGFEFETLPSQNPNSLPGFRFNPDQDRLPPGGRYPGLGPMMDTAPTNLPFRGNGSGMHPQLGGSRRPSVRYDPTSPFDASPFNNPPFGPGNF